MQTKSTDLESLSSLFKVLSDPTRLKLFGILLKRVHCNCELGTISGLANNLISHHMQVLSKAGLITSARKPDDARWIYYSINRNKLDEFQQLLTEFFNQDQLPAMEPVCPPVKQRSRRQNEQV